LSVVSNVATESAFCFAVARREHADVEREKTLMGGAASEGKTALLGLCAVLVVLRAG